MAGKKGLNQKGSVNMDYLDYLAMQWAEDLENGDTDLSLEEYIEEFNQ